MSSRVCKVALLSPFDGGNLGDAAILRALIDNLRSRDPQIDLRAITLDAYSMQKTHGISGTKLFVTGRKFYGSTSSHRASRMGKLLRALKPLHTLASEVRHWLHAMRFLRGVDVLIIAGGGQFDEEWGGPWGQPYALFKWTTAARLVGARVACLSVGVCRLQHRLSRFFVSRTLSNASYVSLRDPWSLEFVHKNFSNPRARLVPDLAFSLASSELPAAPEQSQLRTIGVSPIAYGRPDLWPTKDHSAFETYVEALIGFVAQRLQQNDHVVLFCSDGPDWNVIQDMSAALRSRCSAEAFGNLTIKRPMTLSEVLSVIVPCNVIVASRLHGVILSHWLGKPTIAISYDRKVSTHMRQIGQDAACVELKGIAVDELSRTYEALAKRQVEVSQELLSAVERWQKDLSAQYDDVVGTLMRVASSAPDAAARSVRPEVS